MNRMVTARRFTDLEAWQLCMEMSDLIRKITETGPVTKDREFCDQIRTAADKAAPLIAEGFIRFMPKEFVHYLRMARAEVGEVLSQLDRARRRNYFAPDQLQLANSVTTRAMQVTTGLLRSKLRELENQKSKRSPRPSRPRR
jgi:four helix bundle protein